MTSRIFRSIFLAAAIVLTAGLAFTMGILYQFFGRQLEKELENQAKYLALSVEKLGAGGLGGLSGEDERVTLVATDGRVLYDNQADPDSMENHLEREEIKGALSDGWGRAVRYSETLGERTVYYALRLENGQVLRVCSTQYAFIALVGGMIQPVMLLLAGMFVLSAVFASRASKRIVEPLNRLDLERPARNQTYDELAPLLSKISRQQRTIQSQLAEAKRQQQEFSLITENMSEGLLVIDKQAGLLSCNASALRLLGAGEASANQCVLTLNGSAAFQTAVEKALAGGRQTADIRLDGLCCRLTANPVCRNGETAGAVLLLVDVTEKVRLEELRREFTANVSHEMKTPLTSISGFAELMREGRTNPDQAQSFAGYIYDEARRMTALVEDIIKISQLDEGCLPYEWERVALYDLAAGILERLQKEAARASVTLEIQGDRPTLYTVRSILEEAVYNLCDNGIKYNTPGGRVTVRIKEEGEEVSLSVTDTGIGIPAAHQSRVFERFYRVDKSRSRELGGTGLGLSIVKHGAAYLKAGLDLKSGPDEGSVFTLRWNKKDLQA